ncbi:MAG: hypothetical protein JWR19_4571 [Pedosphaera sp.]|nr:hypothetical protein [Pedosphaera sp.]
MLKNKLTSWYNFLTQTHMKNLNATLSNELEPLTFTDLSFSAISAACATKLEALKNELVRRFTAEFTDIQANIVRQAVDEADALASLTTVPYLLLPTLAEEKIQNARNWNRHQQTILQHGELAFAA